MLCFALVIKINHFIDTDTSKSVQLSWEINYLKIIVTKCCLHLGLDRFSDIGVNGKNITHDCRILFCKIYAQKQHMTDVGSLSFIKLNP